MASGKRLSGVVLTFRAMGLRQPNAVEIKNDHRKQTHLGVGVAWILLCHSSCVILGNALHFSDPVSSSSIKGENVLPHKDILEIKQVLNENCLREHLNASVKKILEFHIMQ